MEYKELIKTIKDDKTNLLKEAATEEEIVSFEEEKKIKLPSRYRAWLKVSDGGELRLPGGVQLLGVKHKPVINEDDSCRPDETFCVIGYLSNGDPLLFKKGKERISIYNKEYECIEDDENFIDFDNFLMRLDEFFGTEEELCPEDQAN